MNSALGAETIPATVTAGIPAAVLGLLGGYGLGMWVLCQFVDVFSSGSPFAKLSKTFRNWKSVVPSFFVTGGGAWVEELVTQQEVVWIYCLCFVAVFVFLVASPSLELSRGAGEMVRTDLIRKRKKPSD